MSVLLVGLPDELAEAAIRRLVAQSDEVRVLTPDARRGDIYRPLGAHVALGDPADDDLVERAAQNVRTIVLGDDGIAPETFDGLIAGASHAGVGRWIYCSTAPAALVTDRLGKDAGEYVVLRTGRRGLLKRSPVTPTQIAEAIDAADDLAGEVRLELDLNEPDAWKALRIERS